MKTKTLHFLLLAVSFVLPMGLEGQQFSEPDFVEGGIAYTILDDGESVGVSHSAQYAGGLQNYTMETVTIPSRVFSAKHNKEFTVKQINDNAFKNSMSYVKNVTIPETIESIGDSAFYNTGLVLVNDHGYHWWENARNNVLLFNARHIKHFGKDCFRYDDPVNDPNFPHRSGNISYCFMRIGNEVEVLPTGMPSVYETNLQSFDTFFVPDNVEIIQDSAFRVGCNTLVLGKGVQYIGKNSLPKCIYVASATPPQCGNEDMFIDKTVLVPVGTREAYLSAFGWRKALLIKEAEYRHTRPTEFNLGFDTISIYRGEYVIFPDIIHHSKKMVQNSKSPDHITHLSTEYFRAEEENCEYDITCYSDTLVAKGHITVLPNYTGDAQSVRMRMHYSAYDYDVDTISVQRGQSIGLYYRFYPPGSKDIGDYRVYDWVSSDTTIARINYYNSTQGSVIGISKGECDITLTMRNIYTGKMLTGKCHVKVTKSPVDPDIAGDLTGDGVVDVDDLNAAINTMLHKRQATADADLNGDGVVDVDDLNAIINMMIKKNREPRTENQAG